LNVEQYGRKEGILVHELIEVYFTPHVKYFWSFGIFELRVERLKRRLPGWIPIFLPSFNP
jgi:hypothetical protein